MTGYEYILFSLIFSNISFDDFFLEISPIWSKCVLKTQNISPENFSINKPYVHILSNAASQPTETTSGVSESQNVELTLFSKRVVS